MMTLIEAAREVLEGLAASDFWGPDPRTVALRTAVEAAEQVPAVVTAEDVADMLESGYDSAEGPTRRWCEEMGSSIAALVAERTAALREQVAIARAETEEAQRLARTATEVAEQAADAARLKEREACARECDAYVDLLQRERETMPTDYELRAWERQIGARDCGGLIRSRRTVSEAAQVVPLPRLRCSECGRVTPDDPRTDMAAVYTCPDCVAKEDPPAPERPAETAVDEKWDGALLARVTRAVRVADQTFERVGGSSRHWVRECCQSALIAEGLTLTDAARLRAREVAVWDLLRHAERAWDHLAGEVPLPTDQAVEADCVETMDGITAAVERIRTLFPESGTECERAMVPCGACLRCRLRAALDALKEEG